MTEQESVAKWMRDTANPMLIHAGDIIIEQAQTIAFLNNIVRDLKDAAKNAGSAWINVKDVQPRPLQNVLIFDGNRVIEAYMKAGGGFMHYDYEAEEFSGIKVEWWKPMPAPPEVEG